MDIFHLILIWGGYAVAVAGFLVAWRHPATPNVLWTGSVVIALLSAILNRLVIA